MRWLQRFCLAGLLCILSGASLAEGPRRVLLLHSLGPYFPPWNTISPQFREELTKRAREPVDIYEASLQGERFGDAPEEQVLVDYLNALFPHHHPALLVAMGAPATRFVLRNRARLLPSAPLLIAASDVRTYSDFTLGANDTACPTLYDPAVQIENILRILPDTTDIVVATGASRTEKFWTDLFRRSLARFRSRVNFEWFADLSSEEMLKRVAALPPRSAIYYPTVWVDARGVPQEGDTLLFQFIDIGRAPVFTHVDSHFGRGIVGGPMLSGREIAEKCAEVAAHVLDGETPGDIRLAPMGLGPPTYDWRQLKRWHIDEASLPAGSIVNFREPTIWKNYWLQILGICAALLAQAALIVGLLIEHRRRSQAEAQSRHSMAELMRMNRLATAGELSASITHEINQPLSGIAMSTGAALNWLKADRPNVERAAAALEKVASATQHATAIVTGLRTIFNKDAQTTSATDVNKVARSVLALVYLDLRKHSIELCARLDETLPAVMTNETQLQQVMLNLVMNAIDAMETAEVRILTVRSERIAGKVRVLIEDTGSGVDAENLARIFDPLFTTKHDGMGMGLSICRSIVEAHGGQIWATSAGCGHGSVFCVELQPSNAAPRATVAA